MQQEKLRGKFSIYDEEGIKALRFLNEGVRYVKLDASGRLQIPKDLIEKGSLVKDLVITSVTTKMEIWDKNLYEQSIDELDDEEFFNLLGENIK